MQTLGTDGVVVLVLTALFLLLLLFEKASLEALGTGLVVVITATGVIGPDDAVAGFANKAVLTIAGLYVVGEGLTRTGAIDVLGRLLTRYSAGSETRTVFLTCIAAAFISAFLNDTAVVVVFIPILLGLAQKTGISASRLMMPLAFAALLGGMCTLVGTSTNLIVSGAASNLGAEPLRMFTMTPVGIPVALACIAFVTLFSRFLLPDRQSLTVMMADTPSREYVTEMRIGSESPLVGNAYDLALADHGLHVLYFVRDEEICRPPFGDRVVATGDVVLLRGGIEALSQVKETMNLRALHDLRIDPRRMELFEITLSPLSRWSGVAVGDLHLHRDYGATAMAVLRRGRHIHERLNRQRLQVGDLLLVCGDEQSRLRLRGSEDFCLLEGEPRGFKLQGRATAALATAGVVVTLLALASVFQWQNLPTSIVALGGAAIMVAVGALTTKQAYRSIDWSILVFIAGTLCLGKAMEATGVARFFASGVLGVSAPLGPAAVVSGMLLLCFLFNFLISHAAVAVLFTPIAVACALELAQSLGHAPGSPETAALSRALVLSVCFGGSLCFATPIAHQVNLMVLGPGGYRYRDFVRLGLPVALIAWVVASVGIVVVTGIPWR